MKEVITTKRIFDTEDPNNRMLCCHTSHFDDHEDVLYAMEAIYVRCVPEYFLVYNYDNDDEGVEPLTEEQVAELLDEMIQHSDK